MLLPIAALATKSPLSPNNATTLDRWFWSVAFGLGYEVAANTALVADYRELDRAITSGGEIPVSVPRIHPGVIYDASRRRPAAVWRAFQCALAANGAEDLSGDPLDYAEPEAEGSRPADVVVGSIYAAEDSPEFMDPPAHQRVLSLVLMNRQTRAVIRRRGLEGISADTAETYGEARAQAVLASQFLPSSDEVNPSNVEAFLGARLERLLAFLRARRVEVEQERDF
jgi:hypothetical protein